MFPKRQPYYSPGDIIENNTDGERCIILTYYWGQNKMDASPDYFYTTVRRNKKEIFSENHLRRNYQSVGKTKLGKVLYGN